MKLCIYVALASIALGALVVYGKLLLAVAAIAILYYLISNQARHPKLQTAMFFILNLTYMTAVTFWYKDIDASGWDNIWVLPQYIWLLTLVFLASAVCTVAMTILFYIVLRFWHQKSASTIRKIYYWGFGMTTAEIVRATLFSVVTQHGSSPIEPMWGMYSVVQLTAHTPVVFLGRSIGVWGLVFVIFLMGAVVAEIIRYILTKPYRNTIKKSLLITGCFLAIVGALSLATTGSTIMRKLRVAAIHQNSSDSNYLKEIQTAITPDPDITTIVVLPEYSNLFHPYANGTIPGLAYDARYTIPEVFNKTNVYFAGTEDDYSADYRYVESYLATGSLQKTKREVKTFLIPGGEYVIGWTSKLIGFFDQDSVNNFSQTRGRTVINTPLQNDTEDPLATQVGIGACSTLLMPYHYRRQVSDGALLLTSNVSYEQFNRAPQYEKISHRFASLTAAITNRPFAIGDRSGSAVIYDSQGKLIHQTRDNIMVEETFELSDARTVYVLLGDSVIFIILALPFLVAVGMQLFARNRKIQRTKN